LTGTGDSRSRRCCRDTQENGCRIAVQPPDNRIIGTGVNADGWDSRSATDNRGSVMRRRGAVKAEFNRRVPYGNFRSFPKTNRVLGKLHQLKNYADTIST
jgi:hypothetical protein